MHAALYTARENRRERVAKEAADHITYSASPPNPDVMSGTQGDGKNH